MIFVFDDETINGKVAAGCTLTSGQPGAAWSGQEVCSGFALAARAGRGSRVYPNVGAAGCTLTSGQPGVAWSGQEVCSGFALAARAARSRRGLLYEFVLYNLYK